ncbi:MAG: YfhO family protein [Cyclobacteriaceae bacterium]
MEKLKPLIPHLISISIGYVAVILFFSPLIFEGKELNQNDINQGNGANSEIIKYSSQEDETVLWTNSMFSGMPTYLIAISWKGDLSKYVQKIVTLNTPSSVQVSLIAFISFYILLCCFGINPWIALLCSLCYALNTFNLVSIEAGHIWKVRAIGYMPLVLAGAKLIFDRKQTLLGFGLLSIATSLHLNSNHLQITYYLLIVLIIFGLSQLVIAYKEKSIKSFLITSMIILGAGIFGVLSNTGRLWTTLEYSKYSTRGKSDLTAVSNQSSSSSGLTYDYVFNWSYGIAESLTLIVPNAFGGPSQQSLDEDSYLGKELTGRGATTAQIRNQLQSVPTYWGDQPFTSGPTYVGAVIFFLFVLGLLTTERKHKTWIIVATIVSLILAWGKNFPMINNLVYDYLPGYNKFRSVSMTMVILLLVVPLLSAQGLQKFIDKKDKKSLLKTAIICAAVFGLVLIYSWMVDYSGAVDGRLTNLPVWYKSALEMDRKSILVSDLFRSVLLSGLVLSILWFHIKGRLKQQTAVISIMVFAVFDVFNVGKRFINDENFQRKAKDQFIQITPADKAILSAGGDDIYRVLNLQNPFNEAQTSANHFSLGGYHGAKIKRYAELIEYCMANQVGSIINSVQSRNTNFSANGVINMLNAQYLKFGNDAQNVLINSHAMGNAWFANEIVPAKSADEELSLTCELNSSRRAIVNNFKYDIDNLKTTSGTIRLTEYSPNRITYQVDNASAGLAVFSEIFYEKGWIASIDGSPADIIQTNYVLRGLMIPEGSKKIVFEFKPDSYYIGSLITTIFSSVSLIVFIGSIALSFKSKNN